MISLEYWSWRKPSCFLSLYYHRKPKHNECAWWMSNATNTFNREAIFLMSLTYSLSSWQMALVKSSCSFFQPKKSIVYAIFLIDSRDMSFISIGLLYLCFIRLLSNMLKCAVIFIKFSNTPYQQLKVKNSLGVITAFLNDLGGAAWHSVTTELGQN